MRSDQPKESTGMSIGAVSQATGIPAGTLRTWERRYGYPEPERNRAGHRVYSRAVVDHLKLIDRAIEAGHRPCNVVGMPRQELVDLLSPKQVVEEEPDGNTPGGNTPGGNTPDGNTPDGTEPTSGGADGTPNGTSIDAVSGTPSTKSAASDTSPLQKRRRNEQCDEEVGPEDLELPEWLETWMTAVQQLDGEALNRGFRNAWNRLGGLQFMEERAGPFLRTIGYFWRQGKLGIVHEHYASQCFRDFLSSQWRPLSERARGPKAICATLPGEDHAIGLHLAALVLSMAGWRIVFLGPRTPLADIVHASRLESANAVFLSISPAYDESEGRDSVAALRRILDADFELVVGGRGAPHDIDGVRHFDSLNPFYDWASEASDGRD